MPLPKSKTKRISTPGLNLQFEKVARDKIDWFVCRATLDDRRRKAFLKNPKQFLKKIAVSIFGKSNGGAVDSQFLDDSVRRAKKYKGPAFPMVWVKVHIPQGPRACKYIYIHQVFGGFGKPRRRGKPPRGTSPFN